ncbi:MAG: hypothetical protein PHE25_01260 [Candidatus Gracilibacteria bacterium]|nr:hypothetical protein [Candidatus Gracilibacteria bacterium]
MKRNNSGFFLALSIIISLILGLFSVIVWKITDTDLYFIDNKSISNDINTNSKNVENIIFKYHYITNTNGEGEDLVFCSGGLIFFDKNTLSGGDCLNGEIINGTDGINDEGNNDDFKESFSTGNIDNLLTIDSRKTDDDGDSRKNIIGIIPPLKEQTVLYINDKLIQAVSLNINNFGDYIKTDVLNNINNLTLNISLNNSSGSIKVFKINKDYYNKTKEISVLEEKQGEIKTLSGYILDNGDVNNIGSQYIFYVKNYDYAINIKNNSSTGVLTYEINGLANTGNNVYLIGINDDIE